ncbi:ImmA/IrrE family metallo-endopeptidase [Gracilimonas sp.]|uniref:ImmA/IrrE family metallo-endopeptidase n=1 Tax=Gracilimonas sp. TaxID=1974203 RepID=UPI003BA939CF
MNSFERIAKKEALDFRESQGLSHDEPLSLKSLLRILGVLITFKPLSNRFSGMAIKNDENRFMLINSSQTVGRQNFTICHELYHLFIQHDFHSKICVTGLFNKDEDEIEYKADLFAVHLLLPEDGIYKYTPTHEIEAGKVSLDTVIELEQLFQCSRTSLLIRLKNLGLITEIQFTEYKEGVIKSALERGHDKSLYKATNYKGTFGDYGKIARNLFENEKISESRYHLLMKDIDINIWDDDDTEEDEQL